MLLVLNLLRLRAVSPLLRFDTPLAPRFNFDFRRQLWIKREGLVCIREDHMRMEKFGLRSPITTRQYRWKFVSAVWVGFKSARGINRRRGCLHRDEG